MLDTLSNVKTRLGITTTDQDAFLTTQITLISDVIEAYCRRRFLSDEYIQTFYSDYNKPSKKMELFHYPVTAVAYVSLDGENLASDQYRIHNPMGRVLSKGPVFFWAVTTEVRYTAGYPTCPTPILAVLDALVGERYAKKTSGVDLNFGSDVQRISIPGAISIDFDYSLANNERKSAYGTILGSYSNVLDDWRSERSVLGTDKMSFIVEAP